MELCFLLLLSMTKNYPCMNFYVYELYKLMQSTTETCQAILLSIAFASPSHQ